MSKEIQTHTALALKILLAVTIFVLAIVVAELSGRANQRNQPATSDSHSPPFVRGVLGSKSGGD